MKLVWLLLSIASGLGYFITQDRDLVLLGLIALVISKVIGLEEQMEKQ